MSIDLRAADPAAALAPDPAAPQAQGLLVDILATPVAAREASICPRFSATIRRTAPISSASSSGFRDEKASRGTPAA